MAASSGAVRAGKAQVELFLEDSAFIRGLNASEKRLKEWGASVTNFGSKLATAGAAGVAAFGGAVAAFVSAGSRLDDMSQRTGASVEALSELEYAATMSGTSLETLEGGLIKLQNKMVDAIGGNEAAAKSFADLGLSVDELSQMSPDAQFEAIADAIAKIEDPAKKTAMAMEIFGKSGQELVPFLNSGAQGLAEMRQQARELGVVMDGESAASAAELGDVFDQLKAQVMQVVVQIGAALAPTLIEVGKAIQPVIRGVIDFVKNNQWLIQTVAAVAAGLLAAGSALVAIGGTAALLSAAISGLVAIIPVATAAFAALVSPIGLTVVGVVAATAAFLTMTETGQALVAYLVEAFQFLFKEVGKTIYGIAAALSEGNWSKAGEIAMVTLRIVIAAGLDSVRGVWEYAWNGMADFLDSVITGMIKGVVDGINMMLKAIDSISPGVLKSLGVIDQLDSFSDSLTAGSNARSDARSAESAAAQKARQDEIAALVKLREALLARDQEAMEDKRVEAQSRFNRVKNNEQITGGGTLGGGTFSALAAQALVGGGPFSQIEKNTKDTAKGVKELVKKKPVAVAGD
jgi:TP901 family phage tail tape measure protein